MASRIAPILFSIILLPLVTLAQSPAAEAEQALRARVTEFLQYHVDGNFRKAYDLVAEDTKDHYFSAGKAKLEGFQIGEITLSDDFTKATVKVRISKTMSFAGQEVPVQVPSTITWKIENGKWVWYNGIKDTWVTPMGPSTPPAPAPKGNDNGDAVPKDFSDQTLAALTQNIMQQIRVDKNEITLATDRPSEEKVILHNGMTGSVQLELTVPEVPGFTVTAAQSIVRAATDIPVVFHYEPGNQSAGHKDPINVQITVQPLNQVFAIRVNFAAK